MSKSLSLWNRADFGKHCTTWLTPQYIIDQIGISDLDPCGYKLNGEFVVKCAEHSYTLQDNQDGLRLPWFGSVYCNPPYTDNAKWLERCRLYHQDTKNDVIVMIFNRSQTKYFQSEVRYATGILFIAGNMKFLNDKGKIQGSANAPSILIAYGESAYNRIKNVTGLAVRIDSNISEEATVTSLDE
jgi:hypothetical protein